MRTEIKLFVHCEARRGSSVFVTAESLLEKATSCEQLTVSDAIMCAESLLNLVS